MKQLNKLTLYRFNYIYDVFFILCSYIIDLFLPLTTFNKIGIGIILTIGNLYALYSFQINKQGNMDIKRWIGVLILGLIVIVIAVQIDPTLKNIALLLARGNFTEAVNVANSENKPQLILITGLLTCYVAILGIIRRLLLNLFRIIGNRLTQPAKTVPGGKL